MSVLFMLASRCSLPISSQVNSFFHMEILPSLQVHFRPCQVPGAGAVFSEVWALNWENQTSCGDLESLRWLPERWELSVLIHIKVLGCLFRFLYGSA